MSYFSIWSFTPNGNLPASAGSGLVGECRLNVQDLTVQALLHENPAHVYHAAMLDPHTAAELDLDQIHALVDDLISAHGDWLPKWLTIRRAA